MPILKQQLKQVEQKFKQDDEDSPVGDENPYGAFVCESLKKLQLQSELDVSVHRFEKGILVTVTQGESRKYSEFFPHEEPLNGEE